MTSALPQVKTTMKGKRFGSIQGIEAARNVQLMTSRNNTSRTASESGESDRISVFEARVLIAKCPLLY